MANINVSEFLNKVEELLNDMRDTEDSENEEYKRKYNQLVRSIQSFLYFFNYEFENAENVHSSFEEKEFTVNMIEAEGALRAFHVVKEHIEQLIESNPELKEQEKYNEEDEEVPF